jgi:hypothetical protein
MKSFKSFFICMLVSIAAKAGIVENTYYFGNYQVVQKGDYNTIWLENNLLSGKAGEPSLPYYAVKLLLPPGEKAFKVEFTGSNEIILPGKFNLFPHQPSQPLSEPVKGELIQNKVIYSTNAFYPEKQTGEVVTGYLNGYAIAMTTFTPVRYNPVTGEIRIFKTVKICITTRTDPEALTSLQNLNSAADNKIKDFIQNAQEMGQYTSPMKSADDYQMLIITPNTYTGSYQSLIDIYLARGIKTQVIATETIYATITGSDNQQMIRNYIIQEYQNHGIEYVLLGGDVEYVPYRGLYAYVVSGSGYEDYGIPADLYYSGLDGNWNTDGDNRWGEPGEDDLLPEIAIARFPFSNATELTSLIHKSVYYQNYPVLGEFNNVTLAGEWLYGSPYETWGSDYLELLIGHHTNNGYETWGIPEDYNYFMLYEEIQSWGANDLRVQINAGRQFIHHVGHANYTYVAYFSNSDITNSNFSGANGTTHNYTILQTHGCMCGGFDQNDCILEKMVNIQNFAVAVIGNSRYGWFNEGQTEGPSAHLHREMMDALYHEKMNHIGAAFTESKIQTAPWVTAPGQWEEGALRWNFYDINILGDPAMSVWTEEPISVQADYDETILTGSTLTSVTVTSGGLLLENFTCAIVKNGVLHGVGITNNEGFAQINLDPAFTSSGTAQLVVSGYNCLPTTFNITVVQGLTINLKAMLQGPFGTTEMNPALNNSGLLPLNQPFNTSPWNYSGIESVSTIPNSNVVDWVLVELRDAPSASSATAATRIARQAAFILKNGSIVGMDGMSYLQFNNLINQQLFVVIWHRNHLSVLSANALTSSAGTYSYDFTTPAGKAFGVNSQNQLTTNIWGMISGDSNGSGLVGTDDLNPFWNTNAGKSGFSTLDLNLDTQLNNVDKDSYWWPNMGRGTNVPQ